MGPVLDSDMKTLLPSSKSGQILFLYQKIRIDLKHIRKKKYNYFFVKIVIFLVLRDFFEPDSETLTSDTR